MKAFRRIDAKTAPSRLISGITATTGRNSEGLTTRSLSSFGGLDVVKTSAENDRLLLHGSARAFANHSARRNFSQTRAVEAESAEALHTPAGSAAATKDLAEENNEELAIETDPEGGASAPKEPKKKLLDYESAKELTRVLEEPDFHKLGAFSVATWEAIAHLTKSWTQFNTGESVNASLDLLERLVLEQELLMQNRSSVESVEGVAGQLVEGEERKAMQQLSRELLSTDFLNKIIKNWRAAWKANETRISPKKILPRLEEYIDRSPSLHPNSKTYNMIMDACTKRFSHTHQEKLGEEIFQRMTNQKLLSSTAEEPSYELSRAPLINGKLRSINDISPDHFTYTTLINVYAGSKNPKAAEEVLCRFTNDFLSGKTKTQPGIHAFSGCIKAWARSDYHQAPEKGQAIIELMQNLDKQPPMENVQPSVIAYNTLLDCWAKSGRKEAGTKAMDLLIEMERMEGLEPNDISYKIVIALLERADGNTRRAENILKRMHKRYSRMGPPLPKPGYDAYRLVLQAINHHKEHDEFAAPRAELYLQQMVEDGLQPDLKLCNCVLACWGASTLEGAGKSAESVLTNMKYLRKPVKPDTLSYNSVINAYANNKQAMKAESFFWQMYKEYTGGNNRAKPNVQTFNRVLRAWQMAPEVSDKERLVKMVELFGKVPKSGEFSIHPDVVSCNTLLSVLAQMGTEESRGHAEQVLVQLEQEYEESRDPAFRPDVFTYSCVMRTHANVGDLHATRQELERMLSDYKAGNEKARPDIVSFNHVLLAIARGARGRNAGAGMLADKVFQQVHELYDAGIVKELPNKQSYDIKINCWANSGSKHAGEEADRILAEMEAKAADGNPHMQPDFMSFSTAINAHAKCGNYQAAEAYYKRMLKEYSTGNAKMKPSRQTTNMVLSAFANAAKAGDPEAPEKAEHMLHEMFLFEGVADLDLQPNAVAFTSVISAWANSGDPRAGERAISLFREVEELARKRDGGNKIQLDGGFYRAVIHACSVSGDIETAEALIDTINKKQLRNVNADRYMYNALLQAYAKSGDKNIGEKAESVLTQMDELSASTGITLLRPHLPCYMSVLECWANSDDHKKAVERSEALLLEMERRGKRDKQRKPTPATYSRVINTMARAGDRERTKILLRRMYTNSELKAVVPY